MSDKRISRRKKMDSLTRRIEELCAQLVVLEQRDDTLEAQWFRWKEIEMKFQSLKYMAQQECTELHERVLPRGE